MNDNPIGVFDSGVGGISVLKELVALMPNENYIYFGDSANAPYGVRSFENVKELTLATAARLVDMGCKCLVIACNTATAAAVNTLRTIYDIPVIGIEPALKPAVLARKDGKVLVIATAVTLKEDKFHHLMEQYVDMAHIDTIAAPGIVEFVERGITDGPELTAYLTELFGDYVNNPPDSLVLGCTHYPFVKDTIARILGPDTYIVDGGNGTARETRHQLELRNLLAQANNNPSIRILNSKESLIPLCEQLLGR